MRTGLYFLVTLVFSACAMMAGLQGRNMWPGYLVGFAAWALFFWVCERRRKKSLERRQKEQLFRSYMERQSNRR
jgi:FtsH-binding integral membrane protein